MSLPIIKTEFSHTMNLPGDISLNFRPFAGAEEKALLLSVESKDALDLAKSILSVTNTCVDGYDFRHVPLCQTEYAFIQIRGKSVGEDQEIKAPCKKCGEYNQVTLNLDLVKYTGEERKPEDMKINVQEDIFINLKEISINDVIQNPEIIKMGDEAQVSSFYEILDSIVDTIESGESIIKFKDEPKTERDSFLGSLSLGVHKKLKNFIAETRATYIEAPFICSRCSEDNTDRRLEGIENFFEF